MLETNFPAVYNFSRRFNPYTKEVIRQMFILSKISNGDRLFRHVLQAFTVIFIITAAVAFSSCDDDSKEGQLTIGYLGDYEGWAATLEIGRAVELAVDHINEAGGVNGHPVILKSAEITETKETKDDVEVVNRDGVEVANRLIEEGVSAFVGPSRSAQTGPVATSVAPEKMVPFISPGSTADYIRDAEDRDFMFRLALPDSVQGEVLADLVYTQDGVMSVSILYQKDDSYTEGLKGNFTTSYTNLGGSVVGSQSHDMAAALTGGEALVVIGFPNTIDSSVKELIARANNAFGKYYFTDSTKDEGFLGGLSTHADNNQINPNPIDGSKGTAPVDLSEDLKQAFKSKHGRDPGIQPFLAEAYDATVALALAAQMAGSAVGTEIRDNLRSVTSGGGEKIGPGIESLKMGLMLASQGDAVNYDGASGPVQWDKDGEVCAGSIGIWEYGMDGISAVSAESRDNPDSDPNDQNCMM